MQISSRFTIAIHIFACIDTFEKDYKITSDFLASSVNANPVVIRRLLAQLKAAGLITVARGTGGTVIARPLETITFYDVYMAAGCVEDNKLFHFHDNPSTLCPVGRNIHNALDDKLERIQAAMENEMKSITVKEAIEDTQKFIAMESISGNRK